ncbi:MAG: hypothetical protein ACK47B_02580 [Armatimonadota bacterium]
MRPLLLGFFLCLIAAVAAAPAPAGPFGGDARLETPLRVQAEGIAVADLLARISAETGVRLSAETEAGDDRLVAFGPARPLREVLADIATLFGHRWRRRELRSGTRAYVLEKPAAVRKREEELAFGPLRRMQGQMEAQVRALRESPRRLALRPETDPIRRHLSEPKARLATELYALLPPEQRAALFDRGRYHLFFGLLPPAYQATVKSVQQEAYRQADAGVESIRSIRAAVRRPPETPSLDFTFQYGSSGGRRMYDRGSLRLYPGGIQFAELRTQLEMPALRGNPYPGRPLATDAKLPELPPAPPGAQPDWRERLRSLSEQSGRTVLADYYRLRFREVQAGEQVEGSGSAEALDQLCLADGSLWWTEGETLFFRKRDWYLRRLYEVPDRWLVPWVRRVQEQGGRPRFGDLHRLAELTFRQQQGFSALGTRLVALPGAMGSSHENLAGVPELLSLLRSGPAAGAERPLLLYDDLSDEAWPAADEAMTLRFPQMTPVQQRHVPFFLALQEREVEALPLETFQVRIRLMRLAPGKRELPMLRADIEWMMKGHQGDFELYLPLAVPDDRRAATSVQRVE